jgi:hypothetical protein
LKVLTETVWAPELAFSRDVAPRAPRRPAVPRLRAHAEEPGNPAVRGPCCHHCAPTANDACEGSRLVPHGLCSLTGERTAIPHWPPVCRTSPPPPRPCLSSYRPRRCVATASMRHRANKAPPASFPRAPEQTLQSASATISAAGELAPSLAPVTNPRP